MIGLDVADLVVIAGQTLGIGPDAALNRVDIRAAQAALDVLADHVITDQDTAAAAGIGLMHALLRHRPFGLRDEQVAVAAGLQFLSLNGWRADLDPPAAAAVVIEALAAGQLNPSGAAAWLSPRLSPRPVPTLPRSLRIRRRARGFRSARPVRGLRIRRPARGLPRPRPARGLRMSPRAAGFRSPRPMPAATTPRGRALASVLLAVAVGGLALLATACSRGPAADPAHAPEPARASAPARAADLAYTTCMRSHGVAAFPYPSATGVIVIAASAENSSRFRSAQHACPKNAAVRVVTTTR